MHYLYQIELSSPPRKHPKALTRCDTLVAAAGFTPYNGCLVTIKSNTKSMTYSDMPAYQTQHLHLQAKKTHHKWL